MLSVLPVVTQDRAANGPPSVSSVDDFFCFFGNDPGCSWGFALTCFHIFKACPLPLAAVILSYKITLARLDGHVRLFILSYYLHGNLFILASTNPLLRIEWSDECPLSVGWFSLFAFLSSLGCHMLLCVASINVTC